MLVGENMDAAEVLGGIFLLTIGILCVVPLPVDGWFIWGPLDAPMGAIVVLIAGGLIVLGVCLVVAGFRSKKKSPMREVVGGVCLIFSFLICFAGLAAESETWTIVFLVFGIGFLVIGLVLVGVRKVAKKAMPKS